MVARYPKFAAWVLFLLLPWCLAMGTGGDPPMKIPQPGENWRVRVMDQTGQAVELTHFALGGQTFVLGKLGEGELAVPFAKAKSVTVRKEGDRLSAQVELREGEPLSLGLDPLQEATGRTSYGNFVIKMGEVERLEFLGTVQP